MAIVNNIVLDGTTYDIEDTINKEVFTQDITKIESDIANVKTAIDGKPTAAISYNSEGEALTITTGVINAPASPASDTPTPLAEGGEIATVNLDNVSYSIKSTSAGGYVKIAHSKKEYTLTDSDYFRNIMPGVPVDITQGDILHGDAIVLCYIAGLNDEYGNIAGGVVTPLILGAPETGRAALQLFVKLFKIDNSGRNNTTFTVHTTFLKRVTT